MTPPPRLCKWPLPRDFVAQGWRPLHAKGCTAPCCPLHLLPTFMDRPGLSCELLWQGRLSLRQALTQHSTCVLSSRESQLCHCRQAPGEIKRKKPCHKQGRTFKSVKCLSYAHKKPRTCNAHEISRDSAYCPTQRHACTNHQQTTLLLAQFAASALVLRLIAWLLRSSCNHFYMHMAPHSLQFRFLGTSV